MIPVKASSSHMERIAEQFAQPRHGLPIAPAITQHVMLRSVDGARDVLGGALIHSGVRRQDADAIAAQICKTCNACTVDNIQLCKAQFMHYILPSRERHVAYCFYLETLCRTFTPGTWAVKVSSGLDECCGLAAGSAVPLSYRRRLHLLYILHDVLTTLWTKHFRLWAGKLESNMSVPERTERDNARVAEGVLKKCFFKIFELAACGSADEPGSPNDELDRFLVALRHSWLGKEEEQLAALQTLSEKAEARRHWAGMELDLVEEYFGSAVKSTSLPLAAKHGVKDDPDAPWHLLPAANGLKMREERGTPLLARALPRGGYPLMNAGTPPSEDVCTEVAGLLSEMRHCFEPFTKADEVQDIDPLGNKVWKDPERPTRNYWGFSEDGLHRMRENKQKFRDSAKGYGDIPPPERPRYVRNSEVERARELAQSQSRGRGGRGGFIGGGRGYRGRGGY